MFRDKRHSGLIKPIRDQKKRRVVCCGLVYGYPVVLAFMAGVCGGLYYRFKRMKWL